MKPLFVAVDVDGTLTKANISFAFGRFLYRKGRISWLQALQAAVRYAAHKIGLLSVPSLHKGMFASLFAKKDRREIEQEVVQFWNENWHTLIRSSVLEELDHLRDQRIALLSASPDFLVGEAAKRLGIHEWYATEYLTDSEGKFQRIGRVVTGEEKAKIVQEVKKKGDNAIMALTDSMLDLPLLGEAAIVVVVSPEGKLARLAKERGWRIVEV